jgi:hypothetical protein
MIGEAALLDPENLRLTAEAPELRVSFADGIDRATALDAAITILRREGVVVLDNLVDPALLEACRQELIARDPAYATTDRTRNLGPYPLRHTTPLVINGLLAKKKIFAPRPILQISEQLLSSDMVIESLGLLVSLPDAPNQGRHFDGLLYREGEFDRLLPPFALSISLPLVRLDEVSGTTAFWRRSHRSGKADGAPDFAPVVPVGSAIVWDFRTIHSGRANHSGEPRPIIFSVHSRDWWMEPKTVTASRYRKLQVARNVYEAFGERMKLLTSRADIID